MVRVVGVHDVLRERSQQLAQKLHCGTFDTFENLLADPQVELVVVATRSIDHVSMGIQALASGKHVLLEKPMGVNLRDADALLKAAAHSKGRLFIRQNRRFEPALLQVQEIIAAGKIGNVFQANLRVHKFQIRNDWQTLKQFGGGQLLNWGPHVIDWALQLLDCPVADVWSDLKRVVTPGDAEDTVKLLLRGTNGRVIDIEISDAVALPQPGWVIHGSRGSIVIETEHCTVRSLDPACKTDVQADVSTPSATGGYAGPAKLVWVDETFPLAPKVKTKLFQTVYATLKQGAAFPVTLVQARENMRIADVARTGTSF